MLLVGTLIIPISTHFDLDGKRMNYPVEYEVTTNLSGVCHLKTRFETFRIRFEDLQYFEVRIKSSAQSKISHAIKVGTLVKPPVAMPDIYGNILTPMSDYEVFNYSPFTGTYILLNSNNQKFVITSVDMQSFKIISTPSSSAIQSQQGTVPTPPPTPVAPPTQTQSTANGIFNSPQLIPLIPPPYQQSASGNICAPGGLAAWLPTPPTLQYADKEIASYAGITSPILRKCECGAHSIGLNKHSDWCQLYTKE